MNKYPIATDIYDRSVLLPLLGLLLVFDALGANRPAPWTILLDSKSGTINANTTRRDLVLKFGIANVVDQDVDVGEGDTEPGTVVFPKDPKRQIEILWKNNEAKTEPKSAIVSRDASLWKAAHDISVGTSLKDLERINGRPFHLLGFQWDYSGTVMSWNGGVLEIDLHDANSKSRVILRLDPPANLEVPESDLSQVGGDQDFSSQNPIMQKINPRVYEIVWIFR